MPLDQCNDLESFFLTYGRVLGRKATEGMRPLHVPGEDPTHPLLGTLLRKPLAAQADRCTAIVKLWERQKFAMLVAACGTGKTMMAISSVHAHANGRPYRAMVMAPDHLGPKWERELAETIPGVKVRRFGGWKDAMAYADSLDSPPTGEEWAIVGRDQSKNMPKRRPSFGVQVRPDGTRATCPACGRILLDSKDVPVDPDALRQSLRRCAKVLDGGVPAAGCGSPLWQYTWDKPFFGWAPAKAIHRATRVGRKRKIDYLVLDECHELKGSAEAAKDSAQARAACLLAASSRKVVAMTGTLIGGYADHLFALLMRLDARSLAGEGMTWDQPTKFNERYGRIETTVTTRNGKGDDDDWGDDASGRSLRSGKNSRSVRKNVRPGIMLTLFGRHLMDKCLFLELDEVAEALPELVEQPDSLVMDPELAEAYEELEDWLRGVVRKMIVKGDRRLLGTMLHALMGYPDYPYNWGPIDAGEYGTFIPRSLDPAVVRPKERALLDLCLRERALARQTWVYVTMTDTRDVAARLEKLIADVGLKVTVLRSSVDRKKREDWITKEGRRHDVIISHPDLVKTGLDLFCKERRGHNFATLMFYN